MFYDYCVEHGYSSSELVDMPKVACIVNKYIGVKYTSNMIDSLVL